MRRETRQFAIGSLAESAGVTVEAIRFYQRKGLLPEPHKPPGAIRRYPPAVLSRIQFIKAAQRLGFNLEEVRELLELDDGSGCRSARERAERKLSDVRGRIAELSRIEGVLADLVARCGIARGTVRCPLIAKLYDAR